MLASVGGDLITTNHPQATRGVEVYVEATKIRTQSWSATNDTENFHVLSTQTLLAKPRAGPSTNNKKNRHVLNNQSLPGISIQTGERSKTSICRVVKSRRLKY